MDGAPIVNKDVILLSVKTQQLNLELFLYKADMDGSSLLHMAVDSSNLKVS